MDFGDSSLMMMTEMVLETLVHLTKIDKPVAMKRNNFH